VFIEFPYIRLSNLKIVERKKSKYFFSDIYFAAQFAAQCGRTTLPFPNPIYAPGFIFGRYSV
jgi:hypothetical protein